MATDTLATISLSKEKQSSLDRFLAKGFPTNKWEEWKYTSLKSLNDFEWNWNTSEKSTNSAPLALENTCEIQTQNGKMTLVGSLPTGVEYLDFASFAAQKPEFIQTFNKRNPILDQNPLYDLNDALASSHQVIWVKKGVKLEKPVLHTYFASVSIASAIQVKLLIYLEEGAELTWVDDLASADDSKSILSTLQAF